MLSIIGGASCVAVFLDVTVAILGDGHYELIKHLFMANLCFDIAAITALATGCVMFLQYIHGHTERQCRTKPKVKEMGFRQKERSRRIYGPFLEN